MREHKKLKHIVKHVTREKFTTLNTLVTNEIKQG